jgi:hypothetical protein
LQKKYENFENFLSKNETQGKMALGTYFLNKFCHSPNKKCGNFTPHYRNQAKMAKFKANFLRTQSFYPALTKNTLIFTNSLKNNKFNQHSPIKSSQLTINIQ